MKHLIFVLSVVFAVGCTHNPLTEDTTANHSSIQSVGTKQALFKVTVVDSALSFEDEEHMGEALKELMQLPSNERAHWYQEKGIVSLESLYQQANEEIARMASRADYAAIQNKYKDAFLFNTNDLEDLVPYFKIEEPIYAPLLNQFGQAVVNGKMVNYNKHTAVEQTNRHQTEQQYIKASKADLQSTLNHLYYNDGKRKMWLDASRVGANIFVRVGAQVHSFWGWNSFRQSYFFNPIYQYDYSRWDFRFKNFPVGVWSETGIVDDGTNIFMGCSEIGGTVSGSYMMVSQSYSVYAGDMGFGATQTFHIGL